MKFLAGRSAFVFLVAVLLLFSAGTAFAQFQGSIRGAVHDSGGAVVPGVDITLTNEATNAERTTISNEIGQYSFTFVAPGTYRLKASLAGFKSFERSGFSIGTQQATTLDVTLDVGAVSEAVQVTADSPLVETATASTGVNLTATVLHELPNTGRNAFMSALLTPNVIHTGNPFYVRQQDQTNSSLLSLGGGPLRGNNYLLDGVPITDLRNRAIFLPNIDAIGEVKVQVNTYDAEMGRTGGGVFNTTLKSGGNQWHGHGMIQQRPDKWSANDFFSNRGGIPRPNFYYWLWGGSFGGPIKKDKTFFWASEEGYHTGTVWTQTLTVPTAAMKTGDFSQAGVTIFDPLTTRPDPANPGHFLRDAFPNNKIPDNRINPVGRALLAYMPDPKNSGLADNYPANDVLADNTWQETVKIDHTINSKNSLNGSYAHYRSREPFAVYLRGTPGEIADGGNSKLFRDVHMPTFNYTMTQNPTRVLNLRFGYFWWNDTCVPAATGTDLAKLGFDPAFANAARKNFPELEFADGYFGNGQNGFYLGGQGDVDIKWRSKSFLGNYSKFVGAHSLKFGGAWRDNGVDFTDYSDAEGHFAFSRIYTQRDPAGAAAGTGHTIASMLLGFPDTGNVLVSTPLRYFTRYWAGYFQDDYRPTAKLTLNMGLRYEYETDLMERDNKTTVGFDRTSANPLAQQITDASLRSKIVGGLIYASDSNKHIGDPQKTKFMPRVGFAYTMTPKTVLRGGYGIFYAPIPMFYPGAVAFGATGFAATTTYFASADGATPANTRGIANPFPSGFNQPTANKLGLLTGVGGNVNFFDQNMKHGRVQQYSLDIQRELPGAINLTLGYIGSSSKYLSLNGTSSTARYNINALPASLQSQGAALTAQVNNPFFGIAQANELSLSRTVAAAQLLRPFPEFQNVGIIRDSDGRARYNAFIAKVERRLDKNLGMQVNYTFAKNLDNTYGESNSFINRTALPLDQYNLDREYSYAIVDIKQKFNIAPMWDLPLGKGHQWATSGAADKILGGWNITPAIQLQSGFPISVWQTPNNAFGSFTYGGQQRPNIVPGVDPCTEGRPGDKLSNAVQGWLNPAAFSIAPAFTFGNAPRRLGNCRGPQYHNMDLAIRKAIPVTENHRVVFRLEVLNATNTPRFSAPNSVFQGVDSLGHPVGSFGRVTSTTGFARIIQYMFRYEF